MSSAALDLWRGPRRARIDRLAGAHAALRASARGRWNAQLNHSLVLVLAAEFQGFARDLHQDGIDVLAAALAVDGGPLRDVLTEGFEWRRALDRGNAHPASVAEDFGRLGLRLWEELTAADPRAAAWRRDLNALNAARNAIAHAHPARLADLRAAGYPVVLRTVVRWRSTLDALAGAMDDVVHRHLAELLGVPAAW